MTTKFIINDAKKALEILSLGIHKPYLAVIRKAFEHGGYVAGGFPRFFLGCAAGRFGRDPRWSQLEMSIYERLGGDIDIFFRTQSGYNSFINWLTTHVQQDLEGGEISYIERSKGGFAMNATVTVGEQSANYRKYGPGFYKDSSFGMKFQFISSHFDEPKEMMSAFDFVNSCVAFDDRYFYAAEEWETCETQHLLKIQNFGSPLLLWRINKYLKKYGYTKLHDPTSPKLKSALSSIMNNCSKVQFPNKQTFIDKHSVAFQILLLIAKSYALNMSAVIFLSGLLASQPTKETHISSSLMKDLEIFKNMKNTKPELKTNAYYLQTIKNEIYNQAKQIKALHPSTDELEEYYNILNNLKDLEEQFLPPKLQESAEFLLEETKQ